MSLANSDIIDIYIVLVTEVKYDAERIACKHIEKPHIFKTNEKAMKYAYERAKKYAIKKKEYVYLHWHYAKKNMLNPNFDENSSSNLFDKWSFQYMPYGQRKYDKMADIIDSLENMSEIDNLQMSNKYVWTCYHSFESTIDPEYEISICEGMLDLNDENGDAIKYKK